MADPFMGIAVDEALGLARAGELAARQLEQDGEAFHALFSAIYDRLKVVQRGVTAEPVNG